MKMAAGKCSHLASACLAWRDGKMVACLKPSGIGGIETAAA
jgi:hypothetical protein